ncbi:Pkinase-domain-containing protein [Lentinula aciculospora]|uniref:Pkinase-domain-containing protein n=1 Tax=Lentinula aciculospora TaxID=153920 RepID=A0A9W9A4J6_9AGAR|nr:Pkinase-domain-containing protein [Lentinula aciculospora]
MSKVHGHKHTGSVTQNQKAHLANAYNELGKELSSHKMRVVGNYTLGRVIGEGAYGKVRIGTHRLTSTRVAIKQIPKSMSASLTREIHHHRQLHHPHVTQMYEVIATESSIWIVTELCSGGELFDYLTEKGRLSEDETKFLFGQLCLAVAYLHEKGIVHRDLKLENVLLDERCRVKLGDFGFTREFERGVLMDTFCGTTGYASPEMLQGKKYLGAEVDIWSLGVILYVLLTGMLPFDDDDEQIMRDKVILGEFEDPEWLSTDARDLVQNILQKEPSKRLTIPQILEHPWFTSNTPHNPDLILVHQPRRHTISPPPDPPTHDFADSALSSEASTTDSSVGSHLEPGTSAPTTPNHSVGDLFEGNKPTSTFHPNLSETTIRKVVDNEPKPTFHHPETVTEEEDTALEIPLNLSRQRTNSSGRSAAPPVHTVRTPARTKRRSVSSTLSDPDDQTSNGIEKTPTLPIPQKDADLNFSSLLITPAPIIFSTPLERELLNVMSLLGFDLGQIVYSVLNDACDSAGAVWWMLKRKAEKKLLEEGTDSLFSGVGADSTLSPTIDEHLGKYRPSLSSKRKKHSMGIQTDGTPQHLNLSRTTPQLTFVPATPTFSPRPSTPPRPVSPSPSRSPMLTPSSSMVIDASKSHPTTPGSSSGSKGRKNRAGSVSIMQRATTALEAAGLVRKKSSEAVREERENNKERERDFERKNERKMTGGSIEERPRSSHGSVSSWRKSPPLRPSKDPSTPPPSELHHPQPHIGSPWVLADTQESSPPQSGSNASRIAPTPANSPGVTDPFSSPENVGPNNNSVSKSSTSSHRNRANILTAFRLWFQEDRKGKRKETRGNTSHRPGGGSGQGYSTANIKRRTSSGNSASQLTGRRGGRRPQRPSMSSRRSSSVNSRTSVASVQMVLLDSPQVAGRRSFGSHTPNSDRADFAPNSSRPSSIRSFTTQQRHRKSPSVSSTGSVHYRATSPMQTRYHRRGGSGSSTTTRVVRQPGTPSNSGRPSHVRSNSAASSIHSPQSSRPTSFIEYNSDYEGSGGLRTSSPYKIRRSFEETTPRRPTTTTFVAQKRQGPFASPLHGHGYGGSVGRSSWKKAWGLEPPGWRTRGAQAVEVLTISPSEGTSLRDVFSGPGRLSLSLGDESDWVDEDDDIPYAAGLGQMPLIGSGPASSGPQSSGEGTVLLGPAPRRPSTTPTGKRGSKGRKVSPVERASPVASDAYEIPESRGGRRQLPAGRSSGPAFKQIMEEDEEAEDE